MHLLRLPPKLGVVSILFVEFWLLSGSSCVGESAADASSLVDAVGSAVADAQVVAAQRFGQSDQGLDLRSSSLGSDVIIGDEFDLITTRETLIFDTSTRAISSRELAARINEAFEEQRLAYAEVRPGHGIEKVRPLVPSIDLFTGERDYPRPAEDDLVVGSTPGSVVLDRTINTLPDAIATLSGAEDAQ